MSADREPFITLANGRIRCARCQAVSKLAKRQCLCPAVKGKRVCRIHGGKSTGPRTEEGRKRCAAAKTIHGWDTRQIRAETRKKMAELNELEGLARLAGMISGPRRRGRKPNGND